MATPFVTRAFLYGEGGSFYQIFRDFLHRVGYRDTTTFRQPSQIADAIRNNIWPVIFIDAASDQMFDALGLLDRFYGTLGHELLPFLVFGSGSDKRIQLYSKGLGAQGFLLRPLSVGEATNLVRPHLVQPGDRWVELALGVSQMLLMRNIEGARSGLVQLASNPAMEKGAEVALLRCEILQGQFSRAEERLVRLLKKFPGDLRMYCEAVDYFRATTQHSTAIKFLKEIEKTNALPHRTWDRVCLSLEIDDLNGASEALEELVKKEPFRYNAMRGYLQLFLFMGLNEYVPHLLKSHSALWREYSDFQVRLKTSKEGNPA